MPSNSSSSITSDSSFLSLATMYNELASKCETISDLFYQLNSIKQTNEILEVSLETLTEETKLKQDLIVYKDSLITSLSSQLENYSGSYLPFDTTYIEPRILQDALELLSNDPELNQDYFVKLKDLFMYLIEFKSANVNG